jgi:hypothetical protein
VQEDADAGAIAVAARPIAGSPGRHMFQMGAAACLGLRNSSLGQQAPAPASDTNLSLERRNFGRRIHADNETFA